MPEMRLKLDGDNAWPDLRSKGDLVIHVKTPFEVALLHGGMASGKASVCFRINLPDGRTVLAETSLELFSSAARAFLAREEATGHS